VFRVMGAVLAVAGVTAVVNALATLVR
jgi:hypothetical protein